MPKAYELVDFATLPGVPCPCGTARRGFAEVRDFPATVHVTTIDRAAETHYHQRLTEVYYILECSADAVMELNDERLPLKQGMAILIRPGTRHRAVGQLRVLIIAWPKFDPSDEIVVSNSDEIIVSNSGEFVAPDVVAHGAATSRALYPRRRDGTDAGARAMNQGKLIIGVFVLLGIVAGLGGYWWNYWIAHRSMEFWGAETARLVRLAPRVIYQQPRIQEPAPDLAAALNDGQATPLISHDLSQARGLIHLRHAILADDQYDWDAVPNANARPRHSLHFAAPGGQETTIYFDTQARVALRFVDGTFRRVQLGPLAESLEKFLARELPRTATAEPAK